MANHPKLPNLGRKIFDLKSFAREFISFYKKRMTDRKETGFVEYEENISLTYVENQLT